MKLKLQKLLADVLLSFSFMSPVSELAEDDILQTFLKERELSGDIIAKFSDMLWLGKIIRLGDAEADVTQQSKEVSVLQLKLRHWFLIFSSNLAIFLRVQINNMNYKHTSI